MEYIIIAFRSRSDTLGFSKGLSSFSVYNQVVNTPKEIGIGCGLSVKLKKGYLSAVKRGQFYKRYRSFVGIFEITEINGTKRIKQIY